MQLMDIYHYSLVRARLVHKAMCRSAGHLIEQQGVCDSGTESFKYGYFHILCCGCPLEISIEGPSGHGCLLNYDGRAVDMLKLMIRREES